MTLSDAMLPRPFRIVNRSCLTQDVVRLDLEPADGGQMLQCAPGQFNMLYRFGVGEVPISVSSSTDERVLGHTIRSVGAVTRSLCTAQPGQVVGVRGPFGKPWPIDQARGTDVLIVAGGIGLAPLRPVIMRLLSQATQFGQINIVYGARTPADLLFINEQERWRANAKKVLVTVDAAGEDWTGYVGFVTALLKRASYDPINTTAMICGPEIMMRFTARDLIEAGVAAGRLFVSLERRFNCAVGLCGQCQLGPRFVCKDGPVFRYPEVSRLLEIPEL